MLSTLLADLSQLSKEMPYSSARSELTQAPSGRGVRPRLQQVQDRMFEHDIPDGKEAVECKGHICHEDSETTERERERERERDESCPPEREREGQREGGKERKGNERKQKETKGHERKPKDTGHDRRGEERRGKDKKRT